MQPRIIFIASLSHSGSTLLDLLLGAHPNVIGLGELHKVLQMSPERLDSEKVMRCTCGQPVADCDFWKPTFTALQNNSTSSMSEKYLAVIDSFQSLFGEKSILVDSSKYLGPLKLVSSLKNIDLKAIHLIKDVRSFCVSQRDSLEAEMKYHHLPIVINTGLSRAIYGNSVKSPSYLYWKWFIRNRSLEKHLRSQRIPYLQIGYDQLAQHPEGVVSQIRDFLDLSPAHSLLPKETNSHIFMGNPMIASTRKMSGVYYDDRWQTRADWKLPHALFPSITAYNKRVVYSNAPELSPS